MKRFMIERGAKLPFLLNRSPLNLFDECIECDRRGTFFNERIRADAYFPLTARHPHSKLSPAARG